MIPFSPDKICLRLQCAERHPTITRPHPCFLGATTFASARLFCLGRCGVGGGGAGLRRRRPRERPKAARRRRRRRHDRYPIVVPTLENKGSLNFGNSFRGSGRILCWVLYFFHTRRNHLVLHRKLLLFQTVEECAWI